MNEIMFDKIKRGEINAPGLEISQSGDPKNYQDSLYNPNLCENSFLNSLLD